DIKFPAPPPSKKLRHEVITGWCDDINPHKLEESGCAVCGRLMPNVDLTLMEKTGIDWKVVEVLGVTRKEHFTVKDSIHTKRSSDIAMCPRPTDSCIAMCPNSH
ncbi:hypothetical protein B0H10DRAFT_1827595, partial [Mycena sp. CBHHK59/15]